LNKIIVVELQSKKIDFDKIEKPENQTKKYFSILSKLNCVLYKQISNFTLNLVLIM